MSSFQQWSTMPSESYPDKMSRTESGHRIGFDKTYWMDIPRSRNSIIFSTVSRKHPLCKYSLCPRLDRSDGGHREDADHSFHIVVRIPYPRVLPEALVNILHGRRLLWHDPPMGLSSPGHPTQSHRL